MGTLFELKWIKSSYSEASGNNCVEVATAQAGMAIRDSKSPDVFLTFTPGAFTALVKGITGGSLGPSYK